MAPSSGTLLDMCFVNLVYVSMHTFLEFATIICIKLSMVDDLLIMLTDINGRRYNHTTGCFETDVISYWGKAPPGMGA